MNTTPAVLLVELLMSVDRVITAAQQATFTVASDEWPPATILGHLSMVDTEVWLPRINLMTSVHGTNADTMPPVFAWWEPDPEETKARFAKHGVDEAGAALLASRTSILQRLREMPPSGWSAPGQHEIFGAINVEDLVFHLLTHDEEHRACLLIGRD